MDYYSILGVSRNASEQDIRKAYKKLSMQHHPDRGGNEEEFKKVNEAYSTLKDPQKRAEYDNPQPQMRSSDFSNAFGADFNDIFSSMFGAGFQQQRSGGRQKNRDIQLRYKIDLKDCFTGKGISLQYGLPSGRKEMIDVRIPPGVRDGDTVNVQQFGDDSIPNLPRGNLHIRLDVIKPKGWEMHQSDLLHTISISIFDLVTGKDVIIHSPEGKNINLKIPKGTQSDTTFSIQGYGLPEANTGRRGTIFVKVKGKTPVVNDGVLIHQIQALKAKIEQ